HAERVGELREQLGEVGETAEESAERFSDMAQGLAEVVAAGGGLAGVVAEAVQFEAAMASVKKAVDATPEAMAHLSSQVKELAIELGMVPEAVAEITAAGGRLGVAFEDLPEFTRLAGQMAVAFDMTAEAAGDSAAKLANVFQIPLSEVRALGDAINTLGNNTAAREGEIVEALTRIGGSARQFGLATEQTAALTASFIALGKSPETAATAINSLLNRLQTGGQGVSGFAEGLEDLGLSANRLADNIRANPQAALREFLGSLEKLDNQQRAITLTKLFGQEYADDISLMVGSLAEYDRQLGLVGDKTKTAGAMQNEFAAQMDTTEKKLEQAQIAIGNLAKELGSQLLPVVASGAQGFAGMAGEVLKFASTHPQITRFVTLLAAAKAASIAFSGAMRVLGVEGTTATSALTAGYTRVTTALAAYRAQVAAASAASAGMSVAMRAQAVATAATTTALRGAAGALSALVRANPLATVITAGAAAFALMSGKVDETTARIRDMEAAVKDANQQYQDFKAQAQGGVPLDVSKAEQALTSVSDAVEKSRTAMLRIQQEGTGAWGEIGEAVKDHLPLIDSQREKLAKVTAELEKQTAREKELKDAIAKRNAELTSQKAIEALETQNKAALDAANHIDTAARATLNSLAQLGQGSAKLTREQVETVKESLKNLTSPAALAEAERYIHQLEDQFKITREEAKQLLAETAQQVKELGIVTTQTAEKQSLSVRMTRDEVKALADAYKVLGTEVPQTYRQMTEGEKEVTDALKNIVERTEVTANEMQGLLQSAFAKVDSSEALAAINSIYQEWKKTRELTEEESSALSQTMVQGISAVSIGLNKALKTLGIEAEQYATGISDKATKAIEAYSIVAKDAGGDTDKLARAWAAMSSAASGSAQEVRAAEAALRQSVGGDEAKADAIKKIADAYKDTGDAAEKALTALNISSADLARGLSTGVSEMLANWQTGMASLKTRGELTAQAVQTAFTSSLSKLSSAADFKALHDEMQRTGTLSRLTAEQMQILRAGMQGGAEAANAMREALKQGTDATRESAEASKAAAEAKEQEAAAERKAAEAKKEAATAEKDSAAAVEEATEKKKKAMMTIYDASKLNAEAIGLVDDAINRMVTSMGHMDADDYLRKVEAMSRVGQQYVADVQRAEAATERLNQRTSDGTVSMHDIAEATHAASSNIAALDSTTLRNLNASIDAAKKKLEDLQQQAKDTAADLDAELAQLKGDDTKTAKLEQQRKLRELEGKLQEARIRGNAEEIAQYERALELQRQIGVEKARQAADKKAEAAARAQESRSRGNATPRSTTASSATSHGAGDISPQQVVDVWDNRIAAAEKRGAQNFANELYHAAKRGTR
ncbi:MAG: phage tail tape measure protein, partial [Cardiobacterium hominis]